MWSPEAQVDDLGTHLDRVGGRIGDRRHIRTRSQKSEVIEHPQRHDKGCWCDSRTTFSILGFCDERAGNERAVPTLIERFPIIVEEVPAEEVIDEPIPVVVYAVEQRLLGQLYKISPGPVDQLRVIKGNAGVHDSYNDKLHRRVPLHGLWPVDVDADGTQPSIDELPRVVERPLHRERRI